MLHSYLEYAYIAKLVVDDVKSCQREFAQIPLAVFSLQVRCLAMVSPNSNGTFYNSWHFMSEKIKTERHGEE